MFVGGCVRNFIKSEIIQDIDIATIFSQRIKRENEIVNLKLLTQELNTVQLQLYLKK